MRKNYVQKIISGQNRSPFWPNSAGNPLRELQSLSGTRFASFSFLNEPAGEHEDMGMMSNFEVI